MAQHDISVTYTTVTGTIQNNASQSPVPTLAFLAQHLGCRAFSHASPTVWDPVISADCLRQRICLQDTTAFSTLEVLDDNCAT